MKRNLRKNTASAFSLVEMLVVIAVIGIMAAVAVPQIGKINDAAKESKDRRNAQNIASVCGSAQAAGLDFVGADVATTVAAVVTGGTVADPGPFQNTYFGVPNVSAADQTSAATYLQVQNGMLLYIGTN